MRRLALAVTILLTGSSAASMRRIAYAAALLAATLISPAQAGEILVNAPARDVTVYADGAVVHRQGGADLPQGAHILKVDGIGASMVEQSLRVNGTGHMQIESVEIRKMARADMNKDGIAALAAKAAEARSRAATAGADLAALEKRRLFLDGVVESAAKATAQNFSATNLHQTLDTIEHDYAAIGRLLVTRKTEVDALAEAAKKAEDELAQAQRRQRDLYEVRVSVEMSESGAAALDLTYRVPDASWAAVYDMRLDSAAGKLTINQDAAVTQDTGEDWSRVALTLTTARSLESFVHTELPGTQTGLRDNPSNRSMAMMSSAAIAPAAPAPAMSSPMRGNEAAPPPMATRKLAIVQAGEFSSDFKINGEVDLPNGIVEKRIPVSAQAVDAKVDLIGVPDFDTHPAIVASFTNGQSAIIVNGKVGLYRDGTYIGTQSVANTNPGEKTTLAFGSDQAVTMKHVLTMNKHGDPGSFGSDESLVKTWTTTVKNNHKHPIKIAVLGRIPVSTDNDLIIEPTGAADMPTRLNGVFTSDLTVPMNGEISIEYGFKAKWPHDKILTGAL